MEEKKNNQDAEDSGDENWLPLEANPEVMNDYVKEMGFNTSKYSFQDLFSLDKEFLDMVPKPCIGLLLLYPYTDKLYEFAKKEYNELVTQKKPKIDEKIYFMEQHAMNACGTIGLFHTMLNVLDKDTDLIEKGSFIEQFIKDTANMPPSKRANYFKENKKLKEKHTEAVEGGQSEVQNEAPSHFITFVEKNGIIYKFDGMFETPVPICKSSKETFLEDSAKIVLKYMEVEPDNIQFTIITLAKTQQ